MRRSSQSVVARFLLALLGILSAAAGTAKADDGAKTRHFLYVAVPGVRDYLEYGGHGLLVFDIDDGHKFVKRIPTGGLNDKGVPLNVKGICANADTRRVYISTIRQLMCLELVSEKLLWEEKYEAGCDRMAITPDGKTIFLPSLEGPFWYVVDAENGKVIRKIITDTGSHNTIVGRTGAFAYLAGLKAPLLNVADVFTYDFKPVGPFSANVRPFTVDGLEQRCYVNVNDLLGFEVGDLINHTKLYRVEVQGYEKGPVKRHGCPSHGIGMTPDELEIWLTDGHNRRLHLFDAVATPPRQIESILLRDEPGWITFSIDGRYAYPSTGDVIEVVSRKIVALLTDEKQRDVQSEKMLEIDFRDGKPYKVGDQFGIGRARAREN